jgi:lipoyl-dependent peroxiredoxin
MTWVEDPETTHSQTKPGGRSMPTRKASATWEGGLQGGNGKFEGESGAVSGSYSFGSRFGDSGGTNPEELLAAAEAACFSMALSGAIEKAGHSPQSVHTDAACSIEKSAEGFTITSIRLHTRARVPGMEEGAFRQLAEQTKQGCPVSRALAAVTIELEASLES